jgi:CRISPR-associated protein, csm2 family
MILTNENYLEKAEKVIDTLSKDKKTGKTLYAPKITTTKLRKILSMVSEIYSDASRMREEKLDSEMRSRLKYLKLHIVYEEGRESVVKEFVEESNLIGALDEVEDSKSKLILFCHYVEALVAYRKFKGNDK